MAANLLHPRNVTYAKPKQETIGVRLGQRFLPCCHSDWIAAVDICNAGGDNDALRSSQEQGCLCERLASSSFAIPNRPVTQLFQFGSGLLHARRRQHVQLKCPNSKRAKLNRFLSHGFPSGAEDPALMDEPARLFGTQKRRHKCTKGAENC